MSAKGSHDILIASHLVPYFALDNEDQNSSLQDRLGHLDYNKFSKTALVDTTGSTGTPLPENYNYDIEFEDIEKGVLNPEDAETLVEKAETFYLIGGRPEICMSNSYTSIVEAARVYDKDVDFNILTPYCFTGPGEGTLEDELIDNELDTELLSGLLNSYDFEHTTLVSENPAVEHIENYLRQTQRIYRAQEVLNRRNYNAQFRTEADRFQNYGSSQIHFKLHGRQLPSGALNGVEHHLSITNIFEELDELESDYSLEIKKQDGQFKANLNIQDEEFELESKDPNSELDEVRQLLSEKAKLPIKEQTEKAEELKKIETPS